MAVMIVAHPIPGFSGRVAVEEVGLNFIGGYTPPTEVPADVQAQLVAEGFTLDASPSVGYPLAYVTHQELEDPDSAPSVALRAAFAPVGAARPGIATVFIGDSIVQGADVPALVVRGEAWPVYASIMSDQQVEYRHNAGVAGQSSTQWLARFDTDVAVHDPAMVIIGGPTNDFTSGGIGFDQSKTNVEALVAECRAIGAVPVLCTLTPAAGASPTSRRADAIKMNLWLRRYAAGEGIILLDFYSLLVDPATGGVRAGLVAGDSLHLSSAGYAAIGQYVADTLGTLLPPSNPVLTGDNGDPHNLLTNGLFLTDTDANGVPDGWTNQPGVTGQTVSLVAGSGDVLGNWLTVDVAASSGVTQIYRSVSTGVVPGNRYLFAARVKSSGGAALYARIRWTATTNRDDILANNLSQPIDGGIIRGELVAPAGATAAQIMFQTPAGTGQVAFAQATVYDLTALGAD